MGVEVRNEFIYPLEGLFAPYLSDYLNDSLFVLHAEITPFRIRLYHRFP
nr:MAG TPA: hypothetical protein [Caudoviricetes sp.]